MKVKIGNSFLEIVKGDITKQNTEAIVNAANNRLSPGGGVSGAIHRAAGPELWEESKKLGGCNTGEAKITKGYNLPSKFVIHTVGPVYSGSGEDSKLLRSSYFNSLKLADKNKIKSISFPAISAGIFGYPMKDASEIALKTIIDYLEGETKIQLVRMVLYDETSFKIHKETLEEIKRGSRRLYPAE